MISQTDNNNPEKRLSSKLKTRQRLRIVSVGYYGWSNFGDELFRIVVRRNRTLFWGPGAVLKDFVFPVISWRTATGPVGSVIRTLEALLGAIWAQKIALCGGSVLSEISGTASLRHRLFRNSRAFEAIGVSVGPFNNQSRAEAVEDVLKDMSRIVVRDAESVRRSPVPVVLAGDLAALYDMPEVVNSKRSGLTICPSSDSDLSSAAVAEIITQLLSKSATHRSVTLLALNSHPKRGDIQFCQEIGRVLQRAGIEVKLDQFESVHQTIRAIASSQAVWSQRLHGVITAYLCGVPVIALSHHPKLTDFARDVGLPDDFLVDGTEVLDKHIDAAVSTLYGIQGSTLPSAEYKRKTRAGFGLGSE